MVSPVIPYLTELKDLGYSQTHTMKARPQPQGLPLGLYWGDRVNVTTDKRFLTESSMKELARCVTSRDITFSGPQPPDL